MRFAFKSLKFPALAAAVITLLPVATLAQHYTQTNLVADLPNVAPTMDPSLINPWGLSRSSGSPWWVSNNGSGTSTLYNGTGGIIPINGNGIVTIPTSKNTPVGTLGSPTGTVFNGGPDFVLPNGKPAAFLFVTIDGTISGWNGGPAAVVVVDNSDKHPGRGAIYTGATTAVVNGKVFLYVTNFHSGRIEVYDTNFKRVHLSEDFFDEDHLPNDFAPFNVQNIGGSLFVTYAKQDSARERDVPGDGNGFVEIFTASGHRIGHLQHGQWFNSPWGVVWTPRDFGTFSNSILVGNLQSGKIAAFNGFTYQFIGFVKNPDNSVLTIDGLWALAFGNNSGAGSSTSLFFTAGPDEGRHGLFGTLTPVATDQTGEVE